MERQTALIKELVEALHWALPLAVETLENHRLMRLKNGHHDIGSGTDHVGLHEEEIERRDFARTAIAAAFALLYDKGERS